MDKKTLIILVLIVIIAIVFIGYFFMTRLGTPANDSIYPASNNYQNNLTPIDESGYREDLKQEVNSILADPNNHQVLITAREKILALSVPGEYRDVHLAIVIAINDLEKDPKAVSEIEDIVNENDWLK